MLLSKPHHQALSFCVVRGLTSEEQFAQITSVSKSYLPCPKVACVHHVPRYTYPLATYHNKDTRQQQFIANVASGKA